MRLNKGKQAVEVGILTGGNKKLTTIYFEQDKWSKNKYFWVQIIDLWKSRHEYHVVVLFSSLSPQLRMCSEKVSKFLQQALQ